MRTTKPIVFTGAVLATPIHAAASGRAQAEQPRGGTVQTTQPNIDKRRLSPDDVRKVAPALEAYTQERLYGEIWKRPGLTPRDRSLVTMAALIARDQSPALTYYFDQALENGVKPREISEVITHLAFYAGWANAFGAVGPARDVFAQRGIGADQLPGVAVQGLPLNEPAEAARAKGVNEQFGTTAPGVVQYTTDLLFRDLWLRPGSCAPRSESRDRQRADRDGTGGTTAVPPQPRDGPRVDAARSGGSPHTPGVLYGVAECLLGAACRERCLRQAPALKNAGEGARHEESDRRSSRRQLGAERAADDRCDRRPPHLAIS